MLRVLKYILTALVLFTGTQQLLAQSSPQVSVMETSANQLMADLEYMIKHSHQPGEWANFEEFMDAMLQGIDRDKLVRMDVLIEESEIRYRPAFPINDIDGFRDNLGGFGIKVRLRSRTGGLYQLDKGFEGWLRFPPGAEYAYMSQKTRDVPFELPDPQAGLEPLLSRKYSTGAILSNTPEGMDERRLALDRVRKETVAAMQKGEQETEDEFALRKMASEHQLIEMQRIFVEAKELIAGMNMSRTDETGFLEFELEGLPGTSLEKMIQEMNQAPSAFANLKQNPEAQFSLRINHPIDELRQKNTMESTALLKKQLAERVNNSQDRTPEQKKANLEVLERGFTIVDNTIKSGNIDAAIEVNEAEAGKQTAVLAVVTPGAKDVPEILKLLPQTKETTQVEMNVAEFSGVAVHKVFNPTESVSLIKQFLGTDQDTLFIGIGENVVWMATGEDALNELQKAIETASQPNTGKAEDPVLSLIVKLGYWFKKQDERGAVPTYPQFRKFTLLAFEGGNDKLTLVMNRKDQRLMGRVDVQKSFLAFIGMLVADFSEKNLK